MSESDSESPPLHLKETASRQLPFAEVWPILRTKDAASVALPTRQRIGSPPQGAFSQECAANFSPGLGLWRRPLREAQRCRVLGEDTFLALPERCACTEYPHETAD